MIRFTAVWRRVVFDITTVSPATCYLSPTYDADGNQTIVKTATGIWQITYNGENRPVRWENGDSVITMSYDRMGRRVTKDDQRFVYNGYLQIANFRSTTTTSDYNYFVWDCTENVATRPLAWQRGTSVAYYTHDGNKNVSEVIASDGTLAAHYEYAPFGALTVSRGVSAAANPWRFSSEYAEDDTATVYYNYRHYEPVMGKWLQRDPIGEDVDLGLYAICNNDIVSITDFQGLKVIYSDLSGKCPVKCCKGKRTQLVPIWHCTRKLGGSGPTSIPFFNHQYLCCDGSNSKCFGVQKYLPSCEKKCREKFGSEFQFKKCKKTCHAKKGDIIEPEVDASGSCEKRCVCPEEKSAACDGCATMPEDYSIGPFGIDCQEWSDSATSSDAE